jgi:uncharacterized protein YndB with AHSA1/START domain
MSKIETSVVIDRPVEEVFAYIADPKNTPEWAGPVIEAKQTSEGAVGLGRATYEITEFEPNKYYADRTTSGPAPINARMSLNPVDGGTELTIEGEIESAGFFKLAEPLTSFANLWFDARVYCTLLRYDERFVINSLIK